MRARPRRGGRGLCLIGEQGLTAPRYRALVFDSRFRVIHERGVQGLLSRARVSPDGRYGATTGFVTGHSYAEWDEFSTLTTIVDMARGKSVSDLEDFVAMRGGRRIRSAGRNFWGVTFARDGDTFYATMRSGGSTSLMQGSVRDRSMRALHENVECPSLSPDGTRVAYKKRVELGNVIWQLYVLDLRTMKETKLAESGLVDDQAEWLDDESLLRSRDAGRDRPRARLQRSADRRRRRRRGRAARSQRRAADRRPAPARLSSSCAIRDHRRR